MFNKLKQMIKQGVITKVSDDSEVYATAQAEYNGKTTSYTRLSPYGLDTNPPKGTWVLFLSSEAQEAVKFGVAHDFLKRFKNLKEGEVALYNTLSKSFIFLKENGDIEVDAKNDLIANVVNDMTATIGNDATIDITGNMDTTVGGNMSTTVTGDMEATVTGDIAATSTTGDIDVTATLGDITNTAAVGNVSSVATLGNIVSTAPAGNITATAALGLISATALNITGTATVKITLAAPTIELAGNVTGVGGGAVLMPNGMTSGGVPFGTHVHTGVTSGASNTGGPV